MNTFQKFVAAFVLMVVALITSSSLPAQSIGGIDELFGQRMTLRGRLYEGASLSVIGGPKAWVVVFQPSAKGLVILGFAHPNDRGEWTIRNLPTHGEAFLAGFSENLLASLYVKRLDLDHLKGQGSSRTVGTIVTSLYIPQEGEFQGLINAPGFLKNRKNEVLAAEILRVAKAHEAFGLSSTPYGSKRRGEFVLTSPSYRETDDLRAGIRRELGSEYTIADWNDLAVHEGDMEAFLDSLGMKDHEVVLITYRGKDFSWGPRHYTLVRGIPHPGALVHARHGDSCWLGSWYGYKGVRVLAKRSSPLPGSAFFDDFNDENYTSNPTWSVWNNDDYPGQVDVINGAVRFLRRGAGGDGGGVKLIANVSIPVDDDTNLQFDGKATYRSVGDGCGWTCNEYPVNMELELDTPSGTVTLRYAINYGNAVKDQDKPTFKQRTRNVARDTWVRGITYRIRDAWPDATAIRKITIFAAGWDFEGYMDNVGIVEIAGSSPSYSEDFSTDPGFTSLAPSYAYWDSSQHNYYVKTRDNLDHKYWAYSPHFGPFDPTSGDVTVQLDMMIENQNWGTYPGVRFFAQKPTDIGNPCVFRISNGNADNNRELLQVNSGLDPSKDYKTPQWSIHNKVWYTVRLTLKSGGAKADIVVKQRSNGKIIGQWTNVDFPTSSFSWLGVGYYDNPDYGSDWAPIRIDNVSISQ